MDEKKGVLYVAFDDSNHTTHGPRPEINLAYFSILPRDANIVLIPKKRDRGLLSRLQSPSRDYRFLLLPETEMIPGENALVISAPSLIFPYLETHPRFDEMQIFVDGRLTSIDKQRLEEQFRDYVPRVLPKGFIKYFEPDPKNPKVKCCKQPFLLGLADFQAHYLHTSLTLEQVQSHEKRVVFRR